MTAVLPSFDVVYCEMIKSVESAGFDSWFMCEFPDFDTYIEEAQEGIISVEEAAEGAVTLMRHIYTDPEFDPSESPLLTFTEVAKDKGLQDRFSV